MNYAEEIREIVRSSREAQGLPARVSDPSALRLVGQMLDAPDRREVANLKAVAAATRLRDDDRFEESG